MKTTFAKGKFKKPYISNEFFLEGFRVNTIEKPDYNGHHILFFHGGAYICDATPIHRKMAKMFVDKGFRVTFLDYPMVPEHTAEFTNKWIIMGYQKLVSIYPTDLYHVFGDSAGGGLGVIFLMLIRDQLILPVPKKSALASPWLDLSMSHPDIPKYIKTDELLPLDGLIFAGKNYAGNLDIRDPYVSPINGNLNHLGDIMLFYSSNELFVPDCEKFIHLVNNSTGTTIIGHKEKGLIHDYLMLVYKHQVKEAYEKITTFFLELHN